MRLLSLCSCSGQERSGDRAGAQERGGAARVLGQYQVGPFKAFHGARAQIADVADRRRHDIQPARAACHYNLQPCCCSPSLPGAVPLMQTRPLPSQSLRRGLALAALVVLSLPVPAFRPPPFLKASPARARPSTAPAPANARERNAAALDEAARRASPADQPGLQLKAARAWLQAERPADAARALRAITGNLTATQLTERRTIEADIDLANGQTQHAWQKISAIPDPTGTPAAPQYFASRMRIALAAGRPVEGVRAEMAAEPLAANAAARRALREELLALLRDARSRGVKLEPESSQDPIVRGWIELGAIAWPAAEPPSTARPTPRAGAPAIRTIRPRNC